jgi:hypothetical protein
MPEPTPASPTPIPSEPCEAEMAEAALAQLADVEGYRYQSIIELEALRRPTQLNNPVFEWVSDRSVGAYLAPGSLREELIGGDPERRFFGYDARIAIDGRMWFLDRGTWQEVPAGFDPHPANAINVILGDLPLPFEAVENVAGIPGEGGCVLRAELADGPGMATATVRIHPVLGRIVAWTFEQDRGPEPGDASRQSMLIEYDVPAASEFQPPPTFEAMPVP